MVESAANRMLVSALKKKPLSLTLSNKGLTYLPEGIGRITSVKSLDLKNNNLKDLPESFSNLKEVSKVFSTQKKTKMLLLHTSYLLRQL